MNATILKLRKIEKILMMVFIPHQVVAVYSAFLKYTTENVVFYGIVVYFTMRSLLSEKPHHIFAFMWSLLTAYLLGWFWGASEVIIYWVSYFIKVKYTPKASSKSSSKSSKKDGDEAEEDGDEAGEDGDEAGEEDDDEDETKEEDSSKVPSFIKKNGYELLQTIQPIFRIPFFGIPKFWHKFYVVKRKKTYLLLNRPFFSFYTKTTDLCSLHRPDLVKEWLQIFNLSEIVIFSDEDKSRLIRIWVSRKNSLPIIADLIENITTACKANDVKRIVGETAPHTGKKK